MWQSQRYFAGDPIDLRNKPGFLARSDYSHRFVSAAPSILKSAKFRICPGQIRQVRRYPNCRPSRSKCSYRGADDVDRVRGIACRGRYATAEYGRRRFPEQGSLFFGKRDSFTELRVRCRIVSAEQVGKTCDTQCINQGGGVPDLARVEERLVGVRERGGGIAGQP